jgi:hypothetical protein
LRATGDFNEREVIEKELIILIAMETISWSGSERLV